MIFNDLMFRRQNVVNPQLCKDRIVVLTFC